MNVRIVSGEGSVFTIKLPAIVSEPKNEGPVEIDRLETIGTSFQEGSAEGGETLLRHGVRQNTTFPVREKEHATSI